MKNKIAPSLSKQILIGVQFFFFAFGATVLVPFLVNMNSVNFIKKVFPSIVVGPVILVIGLTVGIGGATIDFGSFSLGGIGLASVVGVLLNLILPGESKEVHIDKDE